MEQGTETPQQTYERIKRELLESDNKEEYQKIIKTFEDLYGEFNYNYLLIQLKPMYSGFLSKKKRLKTELEELVSKYFKDKNNNGTLIFEKNCSVSNIGISYFVNECKRTILGRVRTFVTEVRKILDVEKIPNDFRLVSIVAGINPESIRDISEYLSKPSGEKVDTGEYFEELRMMCSLVHNYDISHHLESLYSDNNPPVSTTNGGRRSRHRRSPTKKYFKSRRHSSSKKKRHTKRHRKTKRHTMRH